MLIHRLQAWRDLLFGWKLESDPRLPNLGLGACEPLAHGRWRNEEGPSALDRIESSTDCTTLGVYVVVGIDCRGADQQQLETFVGQRVGVRGLVEPFAMVSKVEALRSRTSRCRA